MCVQLTSGSYDLHLRKYFSNRNKPHRLHHTKFIPLTKIARVYRRVRYKANLLPPLPFYINVLFFGRSLRNKGSRKSLADHSLYQRPVSKRIFKPFYRRRHIANSELLSPSSLRSPLCPSVSNESGRWVPINAGRVPLPAASKIKYLFVLSLFLLLSRSRRFPDYRFTRTFVVISTHPVLPLVVNPEPAATQSRKIHGVTADTRTVSRARNEFESPPSIF